MSNITIPSSPEDRKKIMNAIQEISDSLTRISAERDLIKDILQGIEDQYELPKKYARRIAKIYHKQNFVEVKEEQNELEALYETVTGTK